MAYNQIDINRILGETDFGRLSGYTAPTREEVISLLEARLGPEEFSKLGSKIIDEGLNYYVKKWGEYWGKNKRVINQNIRDIIKKQTIDELEAAGKQGNSYINSIKNQLTQQGYTVDFDKDFNKYIKDTVDLVLKAKKKIDNRVQAAFNQITNYSNNRLGNLLEDVEAGFFTDSYIDQVLKKELKKQGIKKTQLSNSDQKRLEQRFVENLQKQREKRVKEIYNQTYKYEREQLNQLAQAAEYSFEQKKVIKASPYLGRRAQALKNLKPSQVVYDKVQKELENQAQGVQKAINNVPEKQVKISKLTSPKELESLLKKYYNSSEVQRFLSGEYINDILKEVGGPAEQALKKKVNTEIGIGKMFEQLESVAKQRGYAVKVAFDESNKVLETFLLTPQEVEEYKKDNKKALEGFRAQGSKTLRLKMGFGKDGAPLGHTIAKGAMESSNTLKLVRGKNLFSVGTGLEATLLRLISLLGTPGWTPESAVKSVKKEQNQEEFTQQLNVQQRNLLTSQLSIMPIIREVAWQVGQKIGATSLDRVVEKLNTVVYNLAVSKANTGDFNWKAIEDSYKLPENVKSVLEMVASFVSTLPLQHMALGSNKGIREGVYTLAPAYFQSPSPVISPNYSKHTSQVLKTGEYSNTAKQERASRQAAGHSLRFVDEKTAEALKDSENQTIKQIQASGQLATFDTLYVEPKQVEEGYNLLKKKTEEVRQSLEQQGKYTEEQIENILKLREEAISSYAGIGITPQDIIGGGIEGDAAIVSSGFAKKYGTTVKSRAPIVLDQDVFKTAVEQSLSEEEIDFAQFSDEDWAKFFSSVQGRDIIKQIVQKEKKIRPEDIVDLDVYQSDGKIQISLTEKQDLQISGKIGSGLQGERNMASFVPQEFIKLVGALSGIDTNAQVIRQYDTASTNEVGGRLMAILQKGLEDAIAGSNLDEFLNKTFGENSPLRDFFEVFSGSDGEVYIQAKQAYDKQGNQIFLDFKEAAKHLSRLENSLGEKMFPHIGQGSRAFVGADSLNILSDYEYRNKVSLGERERLSYLKGLEVAEKELGGEGHFKVLKEVFEDGIFGPTQSSLQAEKEKEAIKRNLAKSTEKDIDETNTIIIGKGGDIDISSFTQKQKEQLLTMDYTGPEGSMGAEVYNDSIFAAIEEKKQEKINKFKDNLISVEGLSEETEEFQKKMQEFIDSLSVAVVSADKNAAFFRYGKDGKEFTGQNLRFSLQEVKTYKNSQTGEVEGYGISQTLTGLTRAIKIIDDFDKKTEHTKTEYEKLAEQGGQIVENLQNLISDPKGAYNTAILKREIATSGWISGVNIATGLEQDKKHKLYSGVAGEGANTELTIDELKQTGVGLGRNTLKKALSQDKEILQKRVAVMYGKTLKDLADYTIDDLQEAIISAVDISNESGEFRDLGKALYRELVGEIFRNPIINNQWDILSTLLYTSKDIDADSESGYLSQALASRDRGDFDKDHWAFMILENEKIKNFDLPQMKVYEQSKRELARFYAGFTKTNAYFREINKLDQPDEEIFEKFPNIPEVLNPILQKAAQDNQSQVGLMSLTHSNISNLAREKGLDQIRTRSLEFLFSSGEQNMVGYKHLIKKIASEPQKFIPEEYSSNIDTKNENSIGQFLNDHPEVLQRVYSNILSAGNEKFKSFLAGTATASEVFDDFIANNIIGTDKSGKNIAKTSFNFELLAQILSGYKDKGEGLNKLKSFLSGKVDEKTIDSLELINFGYIEKEKDKFELVTEDSNLGSEQKEKLGRVPVKVLRALIEAGEETLTAGLTEGTNLARAASNYRNKDRQDVVYNESQMFDWLKGTGEAVERVSKEVSENFETVHGYLQEIAGKVGNIVKILGDRTSQGFGFSNKEKGFLEQIRQTTLSAQIAGNNAVFKKSATYDPDLYDKVGKVELTKNLLNKAGTQYRKNVTFKDFAKAYGYEDETDYQRKIGSSISAAIGTQFHGLNEMALKEAEEYYKSNGSWEGFYKNSLLAKVYNAKDGASALKALQRVEKDEKAKEIGLSFKPYLEQVTKTLARTGITSKSNPELYKQYMERAALTIKMQFGSVLQDIISKEGKIVSAEAALWRKQKTPSGKEVGVPGHADLIGVGEEQYTVIEAGKDPTVKTRNVGTVYDYKNKFDLAGSQKVDLQYVSQVAGYIKDLRDLQVLFNEFKKLNPNITTASGFFGEGKNSFIKFLKGQGYTKEALDQIKASEGIQQGLMKGADWSRAIISYLDQSGESKTVELDFSKASESQMQKLLGGENLEAKEFYAILKTILKSNVYVDKDGNILGPKASSAGSSGGESPKTPDGEGNSLGGDSGKKPKDPYAQTAKEYESHMIEAIRLQKEYEINKKRIASEPLSKRGKELLKLENVDLVEQIALHKQIAREIEKEASQSENFGRTQQKLNREIQKSEHSVVTYGQGASNIFEKMGIDIKRAFMRIFDGTLIYRFFGLVQRGFSQTIQLAKQLDKSMVNLRIVTGGTKSETRELVNVYAQLAKQLGVTTQEVVNGATEWLRQGYTVQESQKLVTASVYLSKLGMIESGQATEYLTSVLKGFKLETSEAVSVVDKLTKVDLEAATSAGNIAEALSRTSVSAQNAGVDLDKLIGYVTEVLQVTQKSASSVGESFKTIFARYQNVKASAFKSMDLSEEAAETTEGINDIERVLNKVGIKIRTSSKEFASFDSILAQLAENWIKYSSVEKAAISTAIAGTRQRENFLALMENYNEAMDIAATSAASAGTAEEKYAAYTEGMEASVSGLTAAWEKLIAKLKASEGLKWLVDSAKKLLDLLPHITGLLSQLAGTGFSKFAVPRVIGSLMGTGQLLKEKLSATEEQKMARAQELLSADGIQGAPERYEEYSKRTRKRVSRSFAKDRLNKSIEDEQEKIDLARQKTKEKAGSFETRFKDTIKTGVSEPLEKIAKTAENIELALEEQQSQEENSSSTDKKPTEQGSGVGSENAASSLKTLRFKKDGSLDLRTLKWAGVSKDSDTYKDITTLFKAYEESPDKEGAFQTLQNSLKELGFEVDNTSLKIRANGEATESNTSSTRKDTQETREHTGEVEENTGATSANTNAKKKETSQEQGAKKAGKGLAIGSKVFSGVLAGVAAGVGAGLTTVAKDKEGNTYDASTAAKATVGTLQGVSAATAAIPVVGPAISGVLGTIFSAVGPSIAAAIDKDKIEREKQLKLAQEQLDALNDIKSGTQSIKQEVIGNEKLSSRDQLTSLYTTVNELQKQAGNDGQLAQALIEETSKLGISDWAGTYYNIYDLTVEEREKFLDAIERAVNIASMGAQDKTSEAESYKKARKELGLKEGETVSSVKDKADFYAKEGAIESLKTFQSNVAKVEAYERERIKNIMEYLYSDSGVAYETEDRLQELGLEGIQEEVLKKLDPETAKILQGLGAIDENNNLTDLGRQIFNQLIKSDQRMYSVINPSSKTLSEIETILENNENNKTAQQGKKEILKSLGLSEEEYDKLSSPTKENIQYLSAAELSGGPSGIQESLAKYNEYLSSLSKNGSLTAEQIAGLPTFLSEVATEPDELLKRIKEKISSLETGYALTSVDAFFGTEGNTKKVLQAQGLYDVSYADKSLQELLESVEISDKAKEKLQGVKNKYLELFTNAAKDLIDTQYLENLREGQITFLNKDIENLNEQKEALQNINKQREYELKLIKAKQQLEDARKEKKRVWREGIGWTYESDQEGIAEAQKNLEEVQAEKQTEDLQQQIDLLTAQKELLEELPDKNQLTEYTKAYLTWFGDVEKSQASVIKAISDGYDSLVNKSKDVSFGDNTTTGTKGAVGEISAGQAETSKAQGQNKQKQYRADIKSWIDSGKISTKDLPENYLSDESVSISEDEYNTLFNKVQGKKSLEDKFKPYIDLVKKAAGISKATGQYISHGSFYNKKTKWTMKTFLFDGNNYDLIKNGAAEFRSLSEDDKKQIVAMPNGWYLALASLGNIDKAADSAYLADALYEIFVRQLVDSQTKGVSYTMPFNHASMNEQGVKKYYKAYASGTFAAEGPALVNELGTEGIITPQGTITAFNGPHGVVPASLTKNLAELGLEAPRLIKELSSVYGLNKDYSGRISNVHDESINARQILVQINADKDFNIDRFVDELKSSVVLNKQNHKI